MLFRLHSVIVGVTLALPVEESDIANDAAEERRELREFFESKYSRFFVLTVGTECVFLHLHFATTIATALDSPNHKKLIGTKNCLSDPSFSVKTVSPISFFVSIFLPALN